MGVETTPDVEESTEPPICPFTETNQPNVTNRLHTKPCDTDKRSISHTDNTTPFETQASKEGPGQNAHLIEPSELASLLRTDLRCVNIWCTSVWSGIFINKRVRNGLSGTEAASRLQRDGPNTVREMEGVSVWGILLRQVSNSLTLVC